MQNVEPIPTFIGSYYGIIVEGIPNTGQKVFARTEEVLEKIYGITVEDSKEYKRQFIDVLTAKDILSDGCLQLDGGSTVPRYMSTCKHPHSLERSNGGKEYEQYTWKSRNTEFDGMERSNGTDFLLGIFEEANVQMVIMLPLSKWDSCDFAHEIKEAPAYDSITAGLLYDRFKQRDNV